ncbi:WD40 repeat domain-containing protein [Nocardia takedensis]|uniref:WD40 repeat domain-containing protein n=1 Tax=Nocardia takedensis TaxID=259390 RepID=UPI0002FA2B5F|nr:hypothetical protein [Nocardia takedensis]
MLIVVDQFEQLFTQCKQARERDDFITALHAAATADGGVPPALVVVVMRADFEPRFAEYPELVAAVQARELITGMSADQLRDAIAEPARRFGVTVDEPLLAKLAYEMRDRATTAPDEKLTGAGALPLMSHALTRTWEKRSGNILTLEGYNDIGGIAAALAGSAEDAYLALTDAQKILARQVFTRLVSTSYDGTHTADRTTRADLFDRRAPTERAGLDHVLESFATQRLLTLTTDTVQLSHEALISGWPRLKQWLDETLGDAGVLSRLRASAGEWDNHARDPSYLYTGTILDIATTTTRRSTADPRHPPLSARERTFLHASTVAAEVQARTRRRRGRILLAITSAAVLAAAAAGIGFLEARDNQGEADRQRQAAIVQRLITDGQARLAGSKPGGDIRAIQEILAARRLDPGPETADVITTTNFSRRALHRIVDTSRPAETAEIGPDGELMAAAGRDGTIRLVEVATGEQTGPALFGHGGPLSDMEFSQDGKTLVTASADGVRAWDVSRRSQIGGVITAYRGPGLKIAISPDGTRIATAGDDFVIRQWDTATSRQRGPAITIPKYRLTGIVFNSDATILATSSTDNAVHLWDAEGGGEKHGPLTGHTGMVWDVAFSPDGQRLASTGSDGSLMLWDVARGAQIGQRLVGNDQQVIHAVFSHDGTRVAAASMDSSIRVWDLSSSHQIGDPLNANTSTILALAFAPDDRGLSAATTDGLNWLFDLSSRAPLLGHEGTITSVTFSSTGELASGGSDGQVMLWDPTTGRRTRVMRDQAAVWNVVFNPRGDRLAAADAAGRILVWDEATGEQVVAAIDTRQPDPTQLWNVAFNRDGTELASGGSDGTIRRWNALTGEPVGMPLLGHRGPVPRVAYDPTGDRLASAGADGTVRLWDLHENTAIGKPLSGHGLRVVSVAFSPDGTRLASAGEDRAVRLWDAVDIEPVGAPMMGHTAPVISVAFSRAGDRLVSGGDDLSVRVWSVATGRQLSEPMTGSTDTIWSTVFSPSGDTIVTAGHDKKIRFWPNLHGSDADLCAKLPTGMGPQRWRAWVSPELSYQEPCPDLPGE